MIKSSDHIWAICSALYILAVIFFNLLSDPVTLRKYVRENNKDNKTDANAKT